jgi:hypothetical protein
MTARPLPVPTRLSYAYSPPTLAEVSALLRTGRAHEALQLLDRLPASIEEERRAAVAAAEAAHRVALAEAQAHVTELRREVQRLTRELSQPKHANPRQLAAALADGRTTPERVAELLKVKPADVARIAEGRVGLSSAAWQRVLAAAAG